MKKTLLPLIASLALLCSCEKIDSHYTYEDTVPGTTITESLLGQKISKQDLWEVTNGLTYEYVRTLPCIEDKGKVYYSLETKPLYGGPYTHQIEFEREYLKVYDGPSGEQLFLTDYTFDDNNQTLYGKSHPHIGYENTTSKLIYVDENYMIFESNGIASDAWYYTDNSEFSRIVYKRITHNLAVAEQTIDERHIYAAFSTVPATTVSEEAISSFEPIAYATFLTTTQDKAYHLQGKYICREKDGGVQYIPYFLPVDTCNSEDYNLLIGIVGGTSDYYTFHEGYTSRYYYGIGSDGSDLAGLEYANYTFNEADQLIDFLPMPSVITYADEECIILKKPLSWHSIHTMDNLEIPHNYGYNHLQAYNTFERIVFVRHTGKLKEPTVVNDYRK